MKKELGFGRFFVFFGLASYFSMDFQIPVKGGRDYITPQKAMYKWYILPIGGLYATYHHLKEPEKSIELLFGEGKDFELA